MSAPPYPNTSAPAHGANLPNTTDQPTPQPPGLGQNHVPPDARGTNRSGAQPYQVHSQNNSTSRGSSAFNGPSAVANSINMDPALLQLPQGGNPPHPASNVNMFFLGSRPVFQSQYLQPSSLQGGMSQQVQSPPSPAENEDQATADARTEDFEKQYTHINSNASDSSPNKKVYKPMNAADGANPFHMNSKGTHDAQSLSQNDMIGGSKDDNDFMVNFQQNGGSHTALSHIPGSKDMNNNDDQSTGDASAAQDSIEAAGDARPSIPLADKRRRPAQDDDNSIGSIDSGAEGLRKTQPSKPQTQRNPAKRVRSIAPVPSIEDEDTMQSSTAQAALKAQDPRMSAVQKMNRRQSLAAADYSSVKIATDKLQGMTREEAQNMYVRRVGLKIDGDDNVDEVKAEPDKWIRAIMELFDAPYNETPEMNSFKAQNLPEFRRWQKEHHALTMEILQKSKTQNLAEATATVVYHAVVDAHEKGALIESPGTSFTHEEELTCKSRLERIIGVLKALTIIRRDIVLGYRLVELVAGPGSVLKRKEENKQENDKKTADKKAKEKEKEKAERKAKEDMETPNKVTKDDEKAKDDEKKAVKKAKAGERAQAKAKRDSKRGGKGKAAVSDSDEKSASDSGEKDGAVVEEASSDADRSESLISIPGSKSVDDESGAYEGTPEVDEDSVYY